MKAICSARQYDEVVAYANHSRLLNHGRQREEHHDRMVAMIAHSLTAQRFGRRAPSLDAFLPGYLRERDERVEKERAATLNEAMLKIERASALRASGAVKPLRKRKK